MAEYQCQALQAYPFVISVLPGLHSRVVHLLPRPARLPIGMTVLEPVIEANQRKSSARPEALACAGAQRSIGESR